MLTQVMNSLLPGFKVALESICNNPQADCIKIKYNIPGSKQNNIKRQRNMEFLILLKTKQDKKTKEHGSLNLKSCNMSQTF